MPSQSHSAQQSSTEETRLRRELVAQGRLLDGLVGSLHTVASGLDTAGVLERVTRESHRLFATDAAVMLVPAAGERTLRPVAAAKEITSEIPETAVLMFTAFAERSLLTRGLESGAKGYILKEAPHQTLLRAIQKVADGDGYVDPALMPAFLNKERENMLTAREREILQLLADGMSNADVAAKLFISQETVKSHVRHILSKLEADTRTHAVAIALRTAIID